MTPDQLVVTGLSFGALGVLAVLGLCWWEYRAARAFKRDYDRQFGGAR